MINIKNGGILVLFSVVISQEKRGVQQKPANSIGENTIFKKLQIPHGKTRFYISNR